MEEQIIMENLTPEQLAAQQQQEQQQQEQEKLHQEKIKARTDLTKELSEQLGLNLFDVEGLKKLKEYQDAQKSDLVKLQEERDSLKNERDQWQKEKLDYQVKLKASELGIANELIPDALKLAENDPEKLTEVIKKYPIFKAKTNVKVGFQNPTDSKNPTDMSEAEAYMAKDPKYKAYYKKK